LYDGTLTAKDSLLGSSILIESYSESTLVIELRKFVGEIDQQEILSLLIYKSVNNYVWFSQDALRRILKLMFDRRSAKITPQKTITFKKDGSCVIAGTSSKKQ
jgi:hypothetical protein